MGNEKGLNNLVFNLILIVFWNIIVFISCVYAKHKLFDENRKMYQIKPWERSGKFYSKTLKIKKWKDLLPQYISKNGFSKRNLSSTKEEYIDEFILETCRAEWAHTMSLLIFIPILFLNDLSVGLILTVIIFAVQLPFIFIQRYNRIRLQKFRKRLKKTAGGHDLCLHRNKI